MQTVQDIKPETLTTYGAIRKACRVIRSAAAENAGKVFDYTRANKYTMSHEDAATLHHDAYMEFHYNEVDCFDYVEDTLTWETETRNWMTEEGTIKDEYITKHEGNIKYWQKAVADELKNYNAAKKVMDKYIK